MKCEGSSSAIALRFQTEGTHHSGNSGGPIVTFHKRLATVLSLSAQLFRIFQEPQKQSRYSGFIAAVKVPSAIESPDEKSRGSLRRANIEDRSSCRHQSIDLAWYNSAKG